jgi:hypothetical protein
MRRSREETEPDLPGSMWHALSRLQRTHPEPVGRIGLMARLAGLLTFTAATDIILAARAQLTGAETMYQLNESLRALTGSLPSVHFTRPDVALEVTISRRHELPVHAAHTVGLTRLFHHAAGTIGARSTPGGGSCLHRRGTGQAHPLWEPTEPRF